MEIKDFIRSLGIENHPGLRVNPKLEGYRNYIFGGSSGPGPATVKNLSHELAHAAQFGAKHFHKRACERGFQFKLRTVMVADQLCDEPLTTKATVRELETFAFQAHLLQTGGVSLDLAEFFSHAAMLMVKFMPDWYNIPGKSDEARQLWCATRCQKFYEQRKPETVLSRLVAWLDATQTHLATHS